MREPLQLDFIVAGVYKTGSTWLYGCLLEHPEVFVPKYIKETNFFSTQWEKGLAWYEKLFTNSRSYRVIGEVSPGYFDSEQAPERIHRLFPDVKLIFAFRDPVGRLYSQYCQHLAAGGISSNIRAELQPGCRLVEKGKYIYDLKRFKKYFTRDQMLFLLHDDLKEDPIHYLKQVFEFIGVDTEYKPSISFRKLNIRKSPLPKRPIRRSILLAGTRLIRYPIIARLYNWFHYRGYTANLQRMIAGNRPMPELETDHARMLADYYSGSVLELSEYVGIDLNRLWLRPYYDREF